MNEQKGDIQYVYLARLYGLFYKVGYLSQYRDSSMKKQKCLEAVFALLPVISLLLIGLFQEITDLLITIAAILSTLEVGTKFLPYRSRADELHKYLVQMSLLTTQMENSWSSYRLGLIVLSSLPKLNNDYARAASELEAEIKINTYPIGLKYKDEGVAYAHGRLADLTSCTVEEVLNAVRK